MNKIDALIAEIKNDLSKYDSAGLIDEDSLYRDIILGLKKFGNDIPQYLQETVIEVVGGYAKLPDGFFSLYVASLCEPLDYKTNNIEQHDLQTSWFYKERVEMKSTWNDCDAACCDEKEEKIIRENIYFKGGSAEFRYRNPTLLKIGRSFKKSFCHTECRNKIIRDCVHEINILDFDNLQANFNKGSIYIQYYGLPHDDEGRVDLPETSNAELEQYLEYRLKRRLAEKLMGNNDAQGIQNLYQIYAQREEEHRRNAVYELKMSKLTPQAMREIYYRNKMQTQTFELNFQF